jgi:hypothetical protein
MCVLDSNILDKFTEQWKYNRNLNMEKVDEIRKIASSKAILDTVLHFVYTDEKLICFDGNHRREALILLNKTQGINVKVCCYIYKINHTDIDKEIVNKFKLINQMTPIPDIYTEIIDNLESNQKLLDKKDIIEQVFQEYKIAYKHFYSVNSKCRRPNFTDTTFKDLCHSFEFVTKTQLESFLLKQNKHKQNKSKILPKQMLNKCETYDFYIFT